MIKENPIKKIRPVDNEVVAVIIKNDLFKYNYSEIIFLAKQYFQDVPVWKITAHVETAEVETMGKLTIKNRIVHGSGLNEEDEMNIYPWIVKKLMDLKL